MCANALKLTTNALPTTMADADDTTGHIEPRSDSLVSKASRRTFVVGNSSSLTLGLTHRRVMLVTRPTMRGQIPWTILFARLNVDSFAPQ